MDERQKRVQRLLLGLVVLAGWMLAPACTDKNGQEPPGLIQDANTDDSENNDGRYDTDSTSDTDRADDADGTDSDKPAFPGSVWTVTESRRLLRDAPAEDAAAVAISAARNEWESFQIFVRASAPVDGVNVVPGPLIGQNGDTIETSEMTLFREHQIEIVDPSPRNEGFEAGWYPDPLIPFELPASASQLVAPTYQAVPFDLPANQSHGFWIDVHVPDNTPAGDYHGTFQVTAGETATNVPVVLTVWDFTLPRVATLKTSFNSGTGHMRGYYADRAAQGIEPEPEDWDGVNTQSSEMLSRHYINTQPPTNMWARKQADGSFEISSSDIEALRQYADKYHINAYSVPQPKNQFPDPNAEFDAWLAAWDEAVVALDRPEIEFFIYLDDEPNDRDAYDLTRYWGEHIVAAGTSLKVLVTEQTTPSDPAWGDLYGAVDIWVPLFPLYDPVAAAARQALGEQVWTYTALAQAPTGKETPWWLIDQPLLNYRVPSWTAWNYGIQGLLYWRISYWNQVDDPWTDPGTFVVGGWPYNGDGTLVYPGRAVGYDGIAPSMRLKALRDSIEDYEYLEILERAGKGAEARAIVNEVTSSWFDWDRDPRAYEDARRRLAELIVHAGASP